MTDHINTQSPSVEQDWNDLSLISLFRVEVETQVTALNHHLISIEQSSSFAGSRYQSRLDELMRAAHSIKGAARIVQVEAAVKISHALEDCFIAAQRGILSLDADHIDVLLMGVDLLSNLGALDEQALAAQLPQCDTDVDDVVMAIEEMVSNAERDSARAAPEETVDEETADKNASGAEADNQKTEIDKLNRQQPARRSVSEKVSDSLSAAETVGSEDVFSAVNLEKLAAPAVASTSIDRAEHSVSGQSRVIRMSADNLGRLVGLAGELLVESNWVQPFADALLDVKRQQQRALSLIEQQLERSADSSPDSAVSSAAGSRSGCRSSSATEESVRAMRACHTRLSDRVDDIEQFSRRFGQLCDHLHREVVASHMCAFEEGTSRYTRLVRDLAKQQGKQVSLEIEGLTTQVDRDILSKLDAPITHLLTNAIAHGIEPAEVRLAKGKAADAKITLSAIHRSGMLVVEVEDDGAGIDFVRLRQKIVKRGLVVEDTADQLSDAELVEFLFLPGFSTAAQVDSIAGRGYGLDLARTMAQSVGGSLQAISPIECDSASTLPYAAAAYTNGVDALSSEGTCFRFCLPLTLSVVRSLLFEAAGEAYAVSLSRITRVLKLAPSDIYHSENRPYFRLNQENISLVSVCEILDLPNGTPHLLKHSSKSPPAQDTRLSVIVIGELSQRYGLCVDQLMEEKDLVVRPLDPRVGKVPNISAAALSEAGAPVLILDVADVLRAAEKAAAKAAPWSVQQSSGASCDITGGSAKALLSSKKALKRVLVVDDSMTVRAMEKNLLQNRGYAVDVAVDGAEGWNAVRMTPYDLVITDVDMPRMSGIDLIRKMRAYEATRELPVIVVSYKDREADQLAGLSAGANYYLTKSSFHNDGLITAVVDLIGSS